MPAVALLQSTILQLPDASTLLNSQKHPAGSTREALAIAIPMIISQSADTFMLFTDRWFLDKISEHHFSATLTGGLMAYTIGVFFFGIITQLNALAGHYHGAERYERCSIATTQAIILAIGAYPVIIFLGIPFGTWLFESAHHEPIQLRLEVEYFRILTYGVILQFLRVVFSCFFAGIGRVKLLMVSQVSSVLLNIPLSWAFVFGKFGLPAMELRGAAYATIIASMVGLLILIGGYLAPSIRTQYAVGKSWVFNRTDFGKLLKFGTPAGLEQLLILGAFNLFVLMMHSFGQNVAAAVTIQFSWNLVAFLPVTGLQIAAMSLVGQHMGAKRPDNAKKSTMATMRVAMIFTGVIVAIYLGFTDELIRVFGGSSATPEVVDLAKVLVRMSCVYLIFDAAYLVYAGALKGAGDTLWSMCTAAALNWLLVAATWYMRQDSVQATPVQIWFAYVAIMLVISTTFAIRFHRGKWQQIKMIDD